MSQKIIDSYILKYFRHILHVDLNLDCTNLMWTACA